MRCITDTNIKNSTPATNIDVTLVKVKNVFAHWLKKIDIKRYPDDVRILPTNNTVSISVYSGKTLKHMPAKALDTIKETLLHDKTKVVLTGNRDRRSNNSAIPEYGIPRSFNSKKLLQNPSKIFYKSRFDEFGA